MTGIKTKTPRTAAVSEADAAHVQYLIRAILAATSAAAAQRDGSVNEHVVADIDLDGMRYLLIRMPAGEPMRAMLSPREFEIVRMVAHGYQNKIIAGILNISTWTVCAHVRRVFAKFGVSSRAAMVARLLETDIGHQPYGTLPAIAGPQTAPRAPQHNAIATGRAVKAAIKAEPAMPVPGDVIAGAASPSRRGVEKGIPSPLRARPLRRRPLKAETGVRFP
jgi:DNA-binding CsgD family transcriptional regulator